MSAALLSSRGGETPDREGHPLGRLACARNSANDHEHVASRALSPPLSRATASVVNDCDGVSGGRLLSQKTSSEAAIPLTAKSGPAGMVL